MGLAPAQNGLLFLRREEGPLGEYDGPVTRAGAELGQHVSAGVGLDQVFGLDLQNPRERETSIPPEAHTRVYLVPGDGAPEDPGEQGELLLGQAAPSTSAGIVMVFGAARVFDTLRVGF